MTPKIFLISPASLGGVRGRALLEERSSAPFLDALRAEGAAVGEVYAFISSLYFRGKIEYARRFALPPAGVPGVWVITPTRGLMSPAAAVTLADLRELADGSIDPSEAGYRDALTRTASAVADSLTEPCEVVLLGSIASGRYVEPLLELFGRRLCVPATFAGRGDMSRGGLLLRCVEAGEELAYVSAREAVRHAPRPPRLDPRR